MSSIATTVAVTEAKVDGLVLAMDSRHKAFERGQDLILEKLKPLDQVNVLRIDALVSKLEAEKAPNGTVVEVARRVQELEDVKSKAAGALFAIQILGVTGVIGGVIAIIRLVTG